MRFRTIAVVAAVLLGGCGGAGGGGNSGGGASAGGGVSVPAQFLGAWSADCSKPYVTFGNGTATDGPSNTTYTLKSAVLQGDVLSVSYDDASRGGTVTDSYAVAGDTLRLTETKVGTAGATWDKAPMKKCS